MWRNIIWDVDGTLFDTYPAIARAFKAALHDLGQEVPVRWIEALAKKSLGHCVSTLATRYQLNEMEIEKRFDEHYELVGPEEQPPFPWVITICEYVQQIGGKNVIVTHRGRESTAMLLAANCMTHYFAGCLTRDDGYPKKPNPAAFRATLEKYELKREETIAVGDRDIDVMAAQGVGLFTCLFGSDIPGVQADLTINNFHDLYQHMRAP